MEGFGLARKWWESRVAPSGVIESPSEDGGMNRETPRLRRAKRQTLNFKLSTSKAQCETLDGSSSCGPLAQTSGAFGV